MAKSFVQELYKLNKNKSKYFQLFTALVEMVLSRKRTADNRPINVYFVGTEMVKIEPQNLSRYGYEAVNSLYNEPKWEFMLKKICLDLMQTKERDEVKSLFKDF